MPLHLIKLCVGCESPVELAEWQQQRLLQQGRVTHITRMRPKRESEVLAGGSLYWVMKGWIRARQAILALDELVDADGRRACALVLQPTLVPVEPRQWRPFQGWRYFSPQDAPFDIDAGGSGPLPEHIAMELRQMGFS